MNILMITSEYEQYVRGGLGVHVTQLVDGLIRSGHLVTVCLVSPQYVGVFDCKIRKWVHARNIESGLTYYEAIEAANKTLYDIVQFELVTLEDIHVIHSHSWEGFLAGHLLSKRHDIPHIVTLHMPQGLFLRGKTTANVLVQNLEDNMILNADHVVAVSESVRKLICERHPDAIHKLSRIYNWISDEFVAHQGTMPDLSGRFKSNGEGIVLFVGRLSDQKGLRILLDSVSLVRAQLPNTRWIIIGKSKDSTNAKYSELRDSSDHILFLDELPRHTVKSHYELASCLVVPSVFEPFGLVAIEAMSVGTPVIASEIDGLSEIITHNQDGILVPFDYGQVPIGPNKEKLAQAQINILRDPHLRARLSRAALSKVARDFSEGKLLPDVINLYYQLKRRE